jgi:anti-anti-sigma factor
MRRQRNRSRKNSQSDQLRNKRLIVDLSQLEYVSSSGLRVFLIVAKRLEGTQVNMLLLP